MSKSSLKFSNQFSNSITKAFPGNRQSRSWRGGQVGALTFYSQRKLLSQFLKRTRTRVFQSWKVFTSNATGEKTAEKNLTFSTKFFHTFFLVLLFISQKLEKKFKKVGNLLGRGCSQKFYFWAYRCSSVPFLVTFGFKKNSATLILTFATTFVLFSQHLSFNFHNIFFLLPQQL